MKKILIGICIISLLILSGCTTEHRPDVRQFVTCDNELNCCDENYNACTPLTGEGGSCPFGEYKVAHVFGGDKNNIGGNVRGYFCVDKNYQDVDMSLEFESYSDSTTKMIGKELTDMCNFCHQKGLTIVGVELICNNVHFWVPLFKDGIPDDYEFECKDYDIYDKRTGEFYTETYRFGDI